MKVRSAKNKGRLLQITVRDLLRNQFKDILEPDDIVSRQMGGAGIDIILTPFAKKLIPFDIECKNKESLSIWSAIEQAEENSTEGRIPMVVFKKNKKKPYCAISLENFMNLIYNKKEEGNG